MINLTIKTKLAGMFGFVSLMVVAIGLLGLHGMKVSDASLNQVYRENLATIEELSKITGLMRENRVQLLLALQYDPRSRWSRLDDHPVTMHTDLVKKNIDEINAVWKAYCAIPRPPEERVLADRFDAACAKVINEGMIPTMN